MSPRSAIQAGGVVLMRETAAGPQTLLVHRPHHKDWSLPKGKSERRESNVEAAARECLEETGIRPILGPFIGRQTYRVMGRAKVVDYWSAWPIDRTLNGGERRFRPGPEVDRVRWVSKREALDQLTYPRDRAFVSAAFQLPPTKPLIVVRHGQALKRSSFKGSDTSRPLNRKGRNQAKRLSNVLEVFGAERLISSDATRCLETLAPYARSQGLQIKELSALGEAAHAESPADAARRTKNQMKKRRSSVLCSHRPVLPTMLSVLAGYRGMDKSLIEDPLSPAELIVVHRTLGKGKPTIVETERHQIR